MPAREGNRLARKTDPHTVTLRGIEIFAVIECTDPIFREMVILYAFHHTEHSFSCRHGQREPPQTAGNRQITGLQGQPVSFHNRLWTKCLYPKSSGDREISPHSALQRDREKFVPRFCKQRFSGSEQPLLSIMQKSNTFYSSDN